MRTCVGSSRLVADASMSADCRAVTNKVSQHVHAISLRFHTYVAARVVPHHRALGLGQTLDR